MTYNPASFLSMLEFEGITLSYRDGKIWPSRKVTDPEIRGFIVANREAIKKELEATR